MNTPAPKIMSTDRVRQRFSEEQILHLVERSLFKMSQSPDRVTEWVSHYRTVYGEVTVVYAREPHSASSPTTTRCPCKRRGESVALAG